MPARASRLAERRRWSVGQARVLRLSVQITLEDLIAEDDKVVLSWTARATHRGEFMGTPATNKQVTVAGIDIYRYAGGKRAETWRQWDTLGLMRQLGMVPSPAQSG
ncbi:MAG: hypothetical protein DMD48_04810 [Gemmatimonadetes bacterium]|nr:MAG: hypothetical protein DMD48_04810 [Gemmatimonadota bacterium]